MFPPVLSFHEQVISCYWCEFVKTYLMDIFRQKISNPRIEMLRLVGRDAEHIHRAHGVISTDKGDSDSEFVMNQTVEGNVCFDGQIYEVVAGARREGHSRIFFFLSALGLGTNARSPKACTSEIIREALLHSPLRNKILNVEPIRGAEDIDISVKVATVESTSLKDIFLEQHNKEALQFFVDCVLHFEKVRKPLRYLLNGKPGTGKTKIIRAIANEVQGKATFILTNGSDTRVDSTFSLAESFSPVVVCIDDVDMLVGCRDERIYRDVLGKFLQRLDGFIESGVFVLATTNDKFLVDLAASRPGRFDQILDIQSLSPNTFLEFIKTKSHSEKIISLFDPKVVDLLEARKVSGAFLAALVKRLEMINALGKHKIDPELVVQLMNQMHTGFYKSPSVNSERVGFLKEN